MAIVVTGSAGFIGQALVSDLLRCGHQVVGIDRVAQTPRPGLLVLTADLLDRDEMVDAAFATADAVFHLAARPGVRSREPDIEDLRSRDNVAATARVLSTVPAQVPLVVTSSSSVYGGTSGAASRESDPLRPRGGYARSKVCAEQLCAERLRSRGIVALARPFTVIGEGQRSDMAVSRWLRAAAEGRPLQVFGSLERRRDFTDVRDVVAVLRQLALRRVCGAVNVGTGRSFSLRELVVAVAAVSPLPVRTEVVAASSVEADSTCADTERLHKLVGFCPRTDLPVVVARQAAAQAIEVLA